MYCYFCGKENDESKKFCKYCGKSLHPKMEDNETDNNTDNSRETEPVISRELTAGTENDGANKGKEAGNKEINVSVRTSEINKAPGTATEHTAHVKTASYNNVLLIIVIILLVMVFTAVGICLAMYLKQDSSDNKDRDKKETVADEAVVGESVDEEQKDDTIQMVDEGPEGSADKENVSEERDRSQEEGEAESAFDQEEEQEYSQEYSDREEDETGEEEEKDEYILPYSSELRLYKSDLEDLTKDECRIARNEIYARHGRRFKDEELQRYFDSKDWYEGTIDPDDFNERELSRTELDNLDLIMEYEKEEGYR
ncbi:MAG: YARHG domain-containing protein [Lachnospiraceae bacterium]|nr:YARHG domain-containing protein [Lachnospiraceae bacterium]